MSFVEVSFGSSEAFSIINFTTMPYTKEELEEKLRRALDASYVVRFIMRYFMFFPLNREARELWAWLDGCNFGVGFRRVSGLNQLVLCLMKLI